MLYHNIINNFNFIILEDINPESLGTLIKLFMLSSSYINYKSEYLNVSKDEPTNFESMNNNFDKNMMLVPGYKHNENTNYTGYTNTGYTNTEYSEVYNNQLIYNDHWNTTDRIFIYPTDNLINEYKNTTKYLYMINYEVYYNTKIKEPIIIKVDTFNEKYNNESFKEIIYINTYMLNEEQIQQINNNYYKNENELYDNINENIFNIPTIKIIKNKPTNESIVIDILKIFTLTDNSADHIKFNNIWKEYSSNKKIDPTYENIIKSQLSTVLLSLGLSKKRYSDGIHWYGLLKKNTDIPKTETKNISNNFIISTTANITDEFNNLLKHREDFSFNEKKTKPNEYINLLIK
jgi:hypothetical protein